MVTFTDNSSGNITQRSWDFGNGLTTNTTAKSFVFPYATPGTNSVTLAISGPGGTNSLTQTAYIIVTNPISIIASNPPTITSQPQNLILLAGSDATFSVQAGGDIPLSYQWRFNSTEISGATNTSYTRLNVQLPDAGLYDVVVTNASGSITSSIAQLNIVSRPLLVDAGLSTNSSFQFTLSGDSGFNYVIEGTTNLSDWLSVATLTNAFGQVLYSDTNFSNAPFVAFRARLLLP
jgi:PKD repeat protein